MILQETAVVSRDRNESKSGLASHFLKICQSWQNFHNFSFFSGYVWNIHWPPAMIWSFSQFRQNSVNSSAKNNRFQRKFSTGAFTPSPIFSSFFGRVLRPQRWRWHQPSKPLAHSSSPFSFGCPSAFLDFSRLFIFWGQAILALSEFPSSKCGGGSVKSAKFKSGKFAELLQNDTYFKIYQNSTNVEFGAVQKLESQLEKSLENLNHLGNPDEKLCKRWKHKQKTRKYSSAKVRNCCRFWRMLHHEYLHSKIGFDEAKNEPKPVCFTRRAREPWFGIVSLPGTRTLYIW